MDAELAAGTNPDPNEPPDRGVLRPTGAALHAYAFYRVSAAAAPRWIVFPIPVSAEIGWTTDTDPGGW